MAILTDFELRTSPRLWSWYDQSARQLAFRVQPREGVESWQTALREKLRELLGARPESQGSPDVQLVESVEQDGFRRDLIVIQVGPGEYMPCYVLIPNRVTPPYKPVIALHGHGTWGARGPVGIADSAEEAKFIQDLNYDYAKQYALRGYLVFAPVLRGFGERMEAPIPTVIENDGDLWRSSCRELSFNAILSGKTLLGMRVWDVMRLIDYIRSRPEPMVEGLGCVGLSGGGMATLFTTALDQRITCAVVSGYVNTFRDSIMSIEHCPCNYVPGILQYAEMPDIAGLLAPRPLLVESGIQDPIFPIAASRKAVDQLHEVYRCFGSDDRLDHDIFDGPHQWSGRKAYDWIGRWL